MRALCDACESALAIVFCAADEAALCLSCDEKVHMCNKLASRHVRVGLATPSEVPRCDICENAPEPMAEKMTSAAPIVVQSDNSNFNIGVVLDENNYDLWAPLVEMHVAGRRKTGYLRGSMKAPEEDDPKYDDWFSEDQRVKSWLLSTMKPELMKRHIRLPTAAAIWRTLKTAFVDEKNGVKIYTLNQKAFRLRQNGRPISIFFGELYEIFQELDHYNTIAMICEKDVKIYQELQEQQRVYIFLGGLDDEFEQIRGEILRKDPLPGLQTSYAYVRREYDRKIAMKNEADHAEAMVARNHIPQRHGERFGSDRMSRSKCAHCGRPGHSKQKCFELIGYPEGWDKTRDPRHGKPRAQIAETKNFLRAGKEELNLVAEHAADDHSIALIAASGHEGYSDQEDDWLWH